MEAVLVGKLLGPLAHALWIYIVFIVLFFAFVCRLEHIHMHIHLDIHMHIHLSIHIHQLPQAGEYFLRFTLYLGQGGTLVVVVVGWWWWVSICPG